jgi:ankyrin repeat protein
MSDDRLFVEAIARNDVAQVSSLIQSGTVNVNGPSWPLIVASKNGRVQIMALLLDAGADIDAIDAHNDTACHVAIRQRHFDALKLLVDRGANLAVDPSVCNPLLKTVSHSVFSDNRFAILLLDAGAPLVHLQPQQFVDILSKSMSVAVLERLLALNVDVRALRGNRGVTVLHYLSMYEWTADVDALARALVVDVGVDVNAADEAGATPFHHASIKQNQKALRVLVELGADVDRQMNNGRTTMHRMCDSWRVNVPCLRLLHALGANVRLVDEHGRTALCFAVHWNHVDAVCALIAAGSDLDQKDIDGEYAATVGD